MAYGDLERTTGTLVEGLHLSQAIGNKWYITVCLQSPSSIAAQDRRFERAARLFAAGAKLSEVSDVVLSPTDHVMNERYLGVARAALTAVDYSLAWSTGYAKHLDDANADGLDATTAARSQTDSFASA